MKKQNRLLGRRALSLLLVLVLAAELLPAVTPTARATGESIPLIEYDADGNISVVTFTQNYAEIGTPFTAIYYNGGLLPENIRYNNPDVPSGTNIHLYEKETGKEIDFVDNYTDRIDYKDYLLRLYITGFQESGNGRAKFSDDVKVYLRQHTDAAITERYTYLPAAHVYPCIDEYTICVEFDLDYTYYDAFHFEKRIIDLHGNTNAVSFPVAWFNKDDLFGDGSVSYDPDTNTLHLKGDVDRFWFYRWQDTEPPRISIDGDVNVDAMYLSAEAGSVIIGGVGTLNLGTFGNGGRNRIVLSGCNAYIEKWDDFTRVELENTNLTAPAGGYVNTLGTVMDENGDFVKKDVAFRREFLKFEDSGTVGTIHWNYDFTTCTFTVSGSGKFERLAPYDKYLDVMESFRTESGVTELGDNLVKDSLHLRKVFLARTVSRIGRNNFSGCPKLVEANLPIGLQYIMGGCFSGSGLKEVSVPRSLLRIDDGCFSHMPDLETITFPYENEDSFLVVGDGCFAHLPWAREIKFGDGPWIIGSGSFCDMPQLTKIRTAKLADALERNTDRIYLGEDLMSIGDYSFSDLPKANYMEDGFSVVASRIDLFPVCHYLYHLPYTLLDIGRGSLGYLNGSAVNAIIDVEPSPGRDHFNVIMPARYGWACLEAILNLANKNILPSSEYTMGDVSYEWDGDALSEKDVQALEDYLNRPLKAITPGSNQVGFGRHTPGSDIDFSGKVDHKDLILLKRRVAGWPGLDSYFDRDDLMDARWGPDATLDSGVKAWRDACEDNYTAATGLKLKVGSAAVDYADGAIVKVPVSSVSSAGYIGGSVTAKWDPEAMELIDVEFNDALAPDNGTGPIDNDLSYHLYNTAGKDANLDLDYAGEHVIRFGDDFRTSNILGAGELFTLVFRLREGAEPSAYSTTKTLNFEVGLKGFDIYDADLNFVRAELTEAGTITTRFGDSVIRSVDVMGIVPPFAGQHPSDSAVLPTDATYKLRDSSLGKVYWLLPPDEDGRSDLVDKGDTFRAGAEYMVWISLAPASDAFTFASDEELSATVNGATEAETWVSDDGKEAYVYCTFTCVDGVAVNSVILNKTEATLTVGESTGVYVAAYDPYTATDLGVTWQSSDSSVAVVDKNGRVTALKAGSAVITATSVNGGKTADCAVTVNKRQNTIREVCVSDITAPIAGQHPAETVSIPMGAGYQLYVHPSFERSVVWLQREDEIHMNQVGKSEAFRAGENYVVWVYLQTKETTTDANRFPPREEMEGTLNGQDANIQWVNDDGTVACVEYEFTCKEYIPVTGITLNKSELSLEAGDSETLTATVTPANASDRKVVWQSSDDTVAAVDQSGKVTAIRAGAATVTAYTDGGGKSANCAVTVTGGGADPMNPFVDVKEGAFYYDAVLWAVNHDPQITNGTDPAHFSPDATCTRGQVVTFLWRAAGCPEPVGGGNPFTDVKADAFYYKAVLWAVEQGVTNGTSPTTFSPGQGCTRGQVVTFLHRFSGTPVPGSSANPFVDVKDGAFYYKAVLWAVNHEPQITNGTSPTTFSPTATCTRGQIVTFLYRAMK